MRFVPGAVQEAEEAAVAAPVIVMKERTTRGRRVEYNYLVAFDGMGDDEGEW